MNIFTHRRPVILAKQNTTCAFSALTTFYDTIWLLFDIDNYDLECENLASFLPHELLVSLLSFLPQNLLGLRAVN